MRGFDCRLCARTDAVVLPFLDAMHQRKLDTFRSIHKILSKFSSLFPENSTANFIFVRASSFQRARKPSTKKMPSKRQRTLTPACVAKPRSKTARRTTAKRDRSQDLRHKWSCFSTQARRRGIEQRLSLEQYSTLVQLPCTYCGKGAVGQLASCVGIDRIDSSVREYSLQNCVSSCSTCNFMKGALDGSVFLNKVRQIAAWRTGVKF